MNYEEMRGRHDEAAELCLTLQQLGAKAVRGLRIQECEECGLLVEMVRRGEMKPEKLREKIQSYYREHRADLERWREQREREARHVEWMRRRDEEVRKAAEEKQRRYEELVRARASVAR